MVFVLRSERAPTKVLRETDDQGVERTFWLWRDGVWVVATRQPGQNGAVKCASSETLELEIRRAGSVTVLKVIEQPQAITIPAPPSEEATAVAISSVIPVAPRVAFGLEEIDAEIAELDAKRRAQGE